MLVYIETLRTKRMSEDARCSMLSKTDFLVLPFAAALRRACILRSMESAVEGMVQGCNEMKEFSVTVVRWVSEAKDKGHDAKSCPKAACDARVT